MEDANEPVMLIKIDQNIANCNLNPWLNVQCVPEETHRSFHYEFVLLYVCEHI